MVAERMMPPAFTWMVVLSVVPPPFDQLSPKLASKQNRTQQPDCYDGNLNNLSCYDGNLDNLSCYDGL